ncbi:hypothetical protein CAEBREN_20611 [Caenorhabditis brenneri]|uniref:Uncharacterized protein n=1 Tax=Caenorhabditis brenneri TaxID=135651 RepID=G0PN53_CAEBE|nr:hypothetical protein CAEBREN_20611 [Caenorhabditis brenneri]
MKIHIDIPPESPAVQRLISEAKMYKDKCDRSDQILRFRVTYSIFNGIPVNCSFQCAHFIFANLMGMVYVIALVSWHSQLCWFNYTTSITILWVSLVTWITRFFWGVCATVMLFIERRALNTLAPKSEELKSLLEDNTDKQEQEKIQKHSAQLKYEREFYAKFVRETSIFVSIIP